MVVNYRHFYCKTHVSGENPSTNITMKLPQLMHKDWCVYMCRNTHSVTAYVLILVISELWSNNEARKWCVHALTCQVAEGRGSSSSTWDALSADYTPSTALTSSPALASTLKRRISRCERAPASAAAYFTFDAGVSLWQRWAGKPQWCCFVSLRRILEYHQ